MKANKVVCATFACVSAGMSIVCAIGTLGAAIELDIGAMLGGAGATAICAFFAHEWCYALTQSKG